MFNLALSSSLRCVILHALHGADCTTIYIYMHTHIY